MTPQLWTLAHYYSRQLARAQLQAEGHRMHSVTMVELRVAAARHLAEGIALARLKAGDILQQHKIRGGKASRVKGLAQAPRVG